MWLVKAETLNTDINGSLYDKTFTPTESRLHREPDDFITKNLARAIGERLRYGNRNRTRLLLILLSAPTESYNHDLLQNWNQSTKPGEANKEYDVYACKPTLLDARNLGGRAKCDPAWWRFMKRVITQFSLKGGTFDSGR